jgi:hypothetical protein
MSASTQASAVTVTFTGQVTEILESAATAPPGVMVGDAVSGSLTYDPTMAAPDTFAGDSTIGTYAFSTADAVLSMSIGALTWASDGTLADSLSVLVYDGFAAVDRYGVNVFGNQPGDFSSFPGQFQFSNDRLSIAVQDVVPPLTLVANDALPDDPSDLQLANVTPGQAVGWIRSEDFNSSSSWQINFDIDMETFTFEVPEPSLVSLLGSGLVVTLARRRIRKRRAARSSVPEEGPNDMYADEPRGTGDGDRTVQGTG